MPCSPPWLPQSAVCRPTTGRSWGGC
jgi:hypothetical protein